MKKTLEEDDLDEENVIGRPPIRNADPQEDDLTRKQLDRKTVSQKTDSQKR